MEDFYVEKISSVQMLYLKAVTTKQWNFS